MNSTNTDNTNTNGLDYIIKYNKETSRLLELLLFTILSILFRIFITLFQICLFFVIGISVIFIPLLIITRIYILLYCIYNTYNLSCIYILE